MVIFRPATLMDWNKMTDARKRIMIGICSMRDDMRFRESLDKFVKEIESDYTFVVVWKKDMRLMLAQNELASEFIESNYNYLLLLDDDQWGHSKDMLDNMFESHAQFATVKTYARHFPFNSVVFEQYPGLDGYLPIDAKQGYRKMHMSGFPMTLIHKSVFSVLEQPFFRERESGGNAWATDEEFCERLRANNIDMIACCDYCLNHADITEENVIATRMSQSTDYKSRLQAKLMVG